MAPLDVEHVRELYVECTFRPEDEPDTCVLVQGYCAVGAFHQGRLCACEPRIIALLAQLPDTFMAGWPQGGGDSLGQAHHTCDGRAWTEEYSQQPMHRKFGHASHPVEQLLLLGLATGRVVFLIPRQYQDLLAGGMPYIVIRSDTPPDGN